MILLYRTASGVTANVDGHWRLLPGADFDALLNSPNGGSAAAIRTLVKSSVEYTPPEPADILAPIGSQEVWAAGVTYYKSRDARMEESKDSGGQDFYAKVYTADRPELFFKASAARVVGHLGKVRVRKDSQWNVPEPEFTLVINNRGQIVGYTIGNDMSSRDIEGENPLYLPQAKVYDGSCALGPAILIRETDMPRETGIALTIIRSGATVFSGETDLTQLKRSPEELVSYLYRETTFTHGAMLLTGTGIVPGTDFSLQSGDTINITIEPIGTLTNTVA
jgi:2-dehydro-3-deoxy-D-arabinonate dehydratase